jgi:hypothetical protein
MPAYEPVELPPNDADFGPSHDQITAELLALTSDFFRQASPTVHTELRKFLTNRGHHPVASLSAFLDALQLNTGPHHSPDEPPA